MSTINLTNPVVIGAATKKDVIDRIFTDLLALYAGESGITGLAARTLIYGLNSGQLAALAAPSTPLDILRLNAGGTALEWAAVADLLARAGQIGLTSQAALDFIYALDGTHFARQAHGTAYQGPGMNADATAWVQRSQPVQLAPTLVTLLDGHGVDDVIKFTVPANTMADGDVIIVYAGVNITYDSALGGTSVGITQKWGSTTVSMVSQTVNNSGGIHTNPGLWAYGYYRIGADVWVTNGIGLPTGISLSGDANCRKLVAPTFSANQVVALNLDMGAADPNYTIAPAKAWVTHFKAA